MVNISAGTRCAVVAVLTSALLLVTACGNTDDRDFSDLTPEGQEVDRDLSDLTPENQDGMAESG
ncbi:MAG: hypothetical protein OEV40_08130 [Acidimicrobiia bacterium]|nr:hypothetical protein [Acidimicrobiia bacterium]